MVAAQGPSVEARGGTDQARSCPKGGTLLVGGAIGRCGRVDVRERGGEPDRDGATVPSPPNARHKGAESRSGGSVRFPYLGAAALRNDSMSRTISASSCACRATSSMLLK